MRVVISQIEGIDPIVFEGLDAVILGGIDNAGDGGGPVMAHGGDYEIARATAMTLKSLRHKLGDEVFDEVVRIARSSEARFTDNTAALVRRRGG
jgi:hypothetical protein